MRTFDRRGFTLVELMATIAILGILTTIAVPSFSRYMSRARQGEAKVVLSAAYAAEASFFPRFTSYSMCLEALGFNPGPSIRYYSVGFRPARAYPVLCGPGAPGSSQNCNTFNWTLREEAGEEATRLGRSDAEIAAAQAQFDCPRADSAIFFGANAAAAGHAPTDGANMPVNLIERTKFRIAAVGRIHSADLDIWEVDETKQVVQTASGLK